MISLAHLQLATEMSEVDGKIDSKKSAAQKAEEIKQMASGTATETKQTIGGIESVVKETARTVRRIGDLQSLESELQVSRKRVRRIKGREVEDMKKGLTSLSKMDSVRASGVSTEVATTIDQVEALDSALSSQVGVVLSSILLMFV